MIAAAAGCRARKRRDGGRVVVRFDFEADMVAVVERHDAGVVLKHAETA